MDPNRILNKENRHTNASITGSFAAQSVALAGNRFTHSNKGGVQRGYSTGTPKKHGSTAGLQNSTDIGGRIGRTSAQRGSSAAGKRPGSRKSSAHASAERGASLSGTLSKGRTPRSGAGKVI